MPKDNALRFGLLGQRDDIDIIALFWTQKMWDILNANTDKDPYQRVTTLATHLKQSPQHSDWTIK